MDNLHNPKRPVSSQREGVRKLMIQKEQALEEILLASKIVAEQAGVIETQTNHVRFLTAEIERVMTAMAETQEDNVGGFHKSPQTPINDRKRPHLGFASSSGQQQGMGQVDSRVGQHLHNDRERSEQRLMPFDLEWGQGRGRGQQPYHNQQREYQRPQSGPPGPPGHGQMSFGGHGGQGLGPGEGPVQVQGGQGDGNNLMLTDNRNGTD